MKTPTLPEVKFTKNGYEIRTEVLEMAKDLVTAEFNYKWQGWEVTQERDEKTGRILNKVSVPEFPGISKVLETAETLYGFINKK